MVDNDQEKEKGIRNVLDWIYKTLQRSGAYPKPTNYKSHQDKLNDREMARAKEIQRQAEEMKKARLEIIQAQNELKFEQMMQQAPDGPEYSACFEKLPKFLKHPKKHGSIAFTEAMKKNFCEINDLERL